MWPSRSNSSDPGHEFVTSQTDSIIKLEHIRQGFQDNGNHNDKAHALKLKVFPVFIRDHSRHIILSNSFSFSTSLNKLPQFFGNLFPKEKSVVKTGKEQKLENYLDPLL